MRFLALCLATLITIVTPALAAFAVTNDAKLSTPKLAFDAFHRAHLAKDGAAAAALLSDPEFYKKKFTEEVATMPEDYFKEVRSIKLIETHTEGNVAVALYTRITEAGGLKHNEMWLVKVNDQWRVTLLARDIPEKTITSLRKWSAERQAALKPKPIK